MRVLFGGLLALTLTGAVAAPALAQTTWNMATPYPEGNFHTENIKMFIEDIEAATEGAVSVTLHTNASLMRMPEIKRGVQTQQAQMGEILISAYGNEDPLFAVDSIPFLAPGFVNGAELWAATGDLVAEKFAEQGLLVLYTVPWPGQGIYTGGPIESTADLEGVKFRTYNAATSRLAELMGAVPTTVQAAEVPQAFATGIVSAMITSAATGVDSQAWDFVTHYYDTRAMNTKNLVFVNADAFDGLSDEHQQAVLEAAADAQLRGWMMSAETEAATTAALAANGIIVQDAPPTLLAQMQDIGRQMAAEWAETAGDEGQMVLQALGLGE